MSNLFFIIFLNFCLLFSSVICSPNIAARPCPFNKPDLTCDCFRDNEKDKSNIFETVRCQIGPQDTMPKFDKASIGQYTIVGELLIQFFYPIRYIEAKSFSAFKSIGRLTLTSKITSSITWNSTALEGVDLINFSMTDIYHFNSAFAALLLVENDLQSLAIDSAGACHFGPNDLKDFKSLKSLSVSETEVSTVDDAAFVGLEDTLQEISLTDAGISKYPSGALQKLQKLKRLNLSGNPITFAPGVTLANFPVLEELRFSETDLQSAIDAGVFENLSGNLNSLDFKIGQLKEIPAKILSATSRLTNLCLLGNRINSIGNQDFPIKNQLQFLCLDKNPISSLENGCFKNLPFVQDLSMKETKLTKLDMSVLGDMNKLMQLRLDNSTLLETMTISSLQQVPEKLQRITLTNSGLKTIDSQFNSLLNRVGFELLDLSNNNQFQCDYNFRWMARQALCKPIHLKIDNAKCANLQNKLLIDYLTDIVQHPCQC